MEHKEFFIIHSNIDRKSVVIDNNILVLIIIIILFLIMVNK
jgi:hypothetical protein